jgi:hypothetical protein
VEGIRSGRYNRRSAEFVTRHRATGGWYFTGCALLGNARPGAPGLPPITLFRPGYKIVSMEVRPMPEPEPAPPPTEATTDLSAVLEEGRRQVAQLRTQNAELRTAQLLNELGSKVTPGMRRHLEPLLRSLLSEGTPLTIRLSDGAERPLADALMDVLRAAPSFDALETGRLADEDPPPPSGPLSPERLAELERKFKMSDSWGFRD